MAPFKEYPMFHIVNLLAYVERGINSGIAFSIEANRPVAIFATKRLDYLTKCGYLEYDEILNDYHLTDYGKKALRDFERCYYCKLRKMDWICWNLCLHNCKITAEKD